jgi:GntR family transcriptional repressor for pyruvate dehydrogenase complex
MPSSGEYERIRPQPIFAQIIEKIRAQIISGALKAGDLLPTERQIAEMMGVNRHTVREALKALEYMGVVQGKTGVGTVITSLGPNVLAERIEHAAHFAPQQFLLELVELRKLLEPGIAALAAERATEPEFAVMEQALRDFEAEVNGTGQTTDGDERLHRALAQATHNSTLQRLIDPVIFMPAQARKRALADPRRRAEAYREHERILQAVRSRQPEAAREAMVYHLSQIEAMVRRNQEDGVEGGPA